MFGKKKPAAAPPPSPWAGLGAPLELQQRLDYIFGSYPLNVESNVEVDSTGLDALRELHEALAVDGKRLALARVKNDLMGPLTRYGLVDLIGKDYVFPTLPVAVEAFLASGESGSAASPKPLPVISPVHRFARVEHMSPPVRSARRPSNSTGE